MIGVRVGDHGAVDRPPGVDEEAAGLAVEARLGQPEDGFRSAHALIGDGRTME
jgi:hypothetical protein